MKLFDKFYFLQHHSIVANGRIGLYLHAIPVGGKIAWPGNSPKWNFQFELKLISSSMMDTEVGFTLTMDVLRNTFSSVCANACKLNHGKKSMKKGTDIICFFMFYFLHLDYPNTGWQDV